MNNLADKKATTAPDVITTVSSKPEDGNIFSN
jgi:hypothetical protein